MSCFWGALGAIIVWRLFSELTSTDDIADEVEKRIRQNVKDEYLVTDPEDVDFKL